VGNQRVLLASLYGSAAEGNGLPSSDVDIGLVVDPKCGLSAYERMQIDFMIATEIERCCDIQEADVRSIDNDRSPCRGWSLQKGFFYTAGTMHFGLNMKSMPESIISTFCPSWK
jgi:hypothetical protein